MYECMVNVLEYLLVLIMSLLLSYSCYTDISECVCVCVCVCRPQPHYGSLAALHSGTPDEFMVWPSFSTTRSAAPVLVRQPLCDL